MKNVVKIASMLILASVANSSCKEKIVDSDDITVEFPIRDQAVSGGDSIQVKARIAIGESELLNWNIIIQDKKGSDIYFATGYCDCKDQKQDIEVKRAFVYKVTKDTEAKMTICAKYKNRDESCETVPFVISK